MMARTFRITILLLVIVTMWGTARVQTRVGMQTQKIQELRTQVEQEFGQVSDSLDGLTQGLDLSVLDSCGIITDGWKYGSCVAIGPDLILTARHCKWDAETWMTWIEIGGVRYDIIDEWASETYDVRFIRINGVVPYVELGQMPELLDEVYLVGAPYSEGLVNTITKGIISHLDRDTPLGNDLIQTDAEGAPGSSGGPLFNTSSQIIGIYVVLFQPGGGVALCVSVDDIQFALEEYKCQKNYIEN